MQTGSFSVSQNPAIDSLPVAGLTRLTTVDYPGQLAAVVFLQGCSWRCGYCHNGDLQPRKSNADISWQNVLQWLETRRGLLDAVVFSGGEPTLHRGLEGAIGQVKSIGFKVGLHTAGIYPERFRAVLGLLDWVGFDIKAARTDYDRVTGVKGSADHAWESARLLMDSGVAHEFRTTVHPDQLGESDLEQLRTELLSLGAEHLVIQHCSLPTCADESLRQNRMPRVDENFLHQLGQSFNRFEVRSQL